MTIDHQAETRAILTELQKRCPTGKTCDDLLACFDDGQWEDMIRCCGLRLRGYQDSCDLYAQGAIHTQLGAVYAMQGNSDRALDHYSQAVEIFRICDGRGTGIALMALGKVYESLAELEKASRSYQESIEVLSSLRDPLAGKVREYQSELGRLSRQHVPETTAHQQEGDIYGRADQEKYRPAQQSRAQEAARLLPSPLAPHRLRVIPLYEGRVAAGIPILVRGRVANYLTTDTFYINDRQFYLRENWSAKREFQVDSLAFALIVTGDSMEPVIHDGDCVLIRKVGVSKGDIVVVRVPGSAEDEVTVKRFHPEKDHIRLSPENETAKTIIIVETEGMQEKINSYYPRLASTDRLLIIVGPESLIEGKVVAVLSPRQTEG
jgi:SOS-response transcriptional repressor LexA